MDRVERSAVVDCLIRCCIDFFELSSEEGRRRIFSCKSPNGPLGRIREVRGSFPEFRQRDAILFSFYLIFPQRIKVKVKLILWPRYTTDFRIPL